MKKLYLLAMILGALLSHTFWDIVRGTTPCAYATDFTQDANCVQSFVLDDGEANTTDKSGSNDLTLSSGTWESGNDGYTFDADATGTFTPALTSWIATDWTIAILSTVDNASSTILYHTYQNSDANCSIRIRSNPYAPYNRFTATLNRRYDSPSWLIATQDGSKKWRFVTYDSATSTATIYVNGTQVATEDADEYGSMTMDTGVLGSGSTHTIYEIAVFNRKLTEKEMGDITTNGLIAGESPSVVNTDNQIITIW